MAYQFETLPQLVDHRNSIPSNGNYSRRVRSIKTRVWHHSLTKKHLGGSDAASFSKYHISLGWPKIGYALVIEPKNIINTPKGKRARIVYANDINLRTYHVGNSNQWALGICVAGDYRYDELDDATKATIDELQEALVSDRIGSEDKSHNEMPGYSWKACCEYNYMEAFKFLDGKVTQGPLPNTYTVQEGDTLWGIANGLKGLSADDLIKANPKVDPKKLRIGQVINLGNAKKTPSKPSKPSNKNKATGPVADIQDTVNDRYGYNIAVDNIPGPETFKALLKAYQTELNKQFNAGLKVDGIWGPKTAAASVTVRKGAKGNLTWILQAMLYCKGHKIKVDGVFGGKTKNAVKAFQRSVGIAVDGVPGAVTFAKLFE